MRLKNVKNAKEIMNSGKYYIDTPEVYKGNWNKKFGNNNKIYIEIGMGKGDFIIKNAIRYPDINFIGIEKFDSVIARAIQKSNSMELNNLFLIRLYALNIENIFDKEIDKIYLNFSDPWPKERHTKRRLTSNVFLEKYDKIFKNTKLIELKTDNINLFNFSRETLKDYGYDIYFETNDLDTKDENNITTEYEEKFSSRGIKINKLCAKK